MVGVREHDLQRASYSGLKYTKFSDNYQKHSCVSQKDWSPGAAEQSPVCVLMSAL